MPLTAFHPTAQTWFQRELGTPTDAQQQAWPAIRAGKHTLISAPTGSGKTLAAFYAVIDRLLQQGLRGELQQQTQVIYISPLKALSNDIERNLQLPLRGLLDELLLQQMAPVDITVAVRTGDTTSSDRQKMLRQPPHILVTTPESLYLLLTAERGRQMVQTTSTIIIDEIHAMLGDKRGSHLALSIERLQALVDTPLQRIGLSATQKPIDKVARFLTGNSQNECTIVNTGHRRHLELCLEVPQSPLSAIMANEVWGELYQRLVELINQHTTTLIFVNTRRLSERLALALTEHIGEENVSSHHGSMSKEHRFIAEQRLKQGELKVLVATASMELGIDIGAVDLVVQFSSPKSIAAFLQRVGRSGHSVNGTPKGVLFPLTRDDLIECAALIHSIHQGELDQIIMPEQPLDILAQQIVAEVAGRDWPVNALFDVLSNAYPYRELTYDEFIRIVKMLADGFTTRRGRRSAYIHFDAINNELRARKNARLTALTCGGAIPDLFDYSVVLDPENVVVGSLNEDFALESLPGDIFSLGSHCWQVLGIDGLKVRVLDAQGQKPSVPFWLGEGPGRTKELSEAVSDLRSKIRDMLATDNNAMANAAQWLIADVGLSESAAEQLVEYLHVGQAALGVMPTRNTIAMERFFDEVGDMHVVIHSPYGSRLNKAWGLALRKRFCKAFNFELQAAANEDSIVISLGTVHSFPLNDVFKYLSSKTVRDVLIQAMLDAPMFEVRWRWNASRALAIQRNRSGKRVPPQFQRMQSEDLVAQLFPDQIACFENIQGARDIPDHPLVNQTIHDCLTEAMDINELIALLKNIENDNITLVAKDLTEPSPFAQEIINANPYAFLDDAPFEERRTNAIRHRRWLDPSEVTEFSELSQEAIDRVCEEAWPLCNSVDDMHDALMTIGIMLDDEIKQREWLTTLEKTQRAMSFTINETVMWCASERASKINVIYNNPLALEALPTWLQEQSWTKEDAVREVVRCRIECLGPVTQTALANQLQLPERDIQIGLLALENEGFIFRGQFTPQLGQEEWCERRLLQRIHKYTIDSHRKSIQPVSIQDYIRFLFQHHHIDTDTPVTGVESLYTIITQLDGSTAAASAWENDILPCRMKHYDGSWLDMLCMSGRVSWCRLQKSDKPNKAIKSTPINIITRSNNPLWQTLHATDDLNVTNNVYDDLQQHGASFKADIVSRTGQLPVQVDENIAELIAAGLVTNDSFAGLRQLLLPHHKRKRHRVGFTHTGRWSLMTTHQQNELNDEMLEQLISIYLNRWGIISRKVLERESNAPPWRNLVRVLRRLELQGQIRGGRFIAGIHGEQFARAETVTLLRNISKQAPNSKLLAISAADPLNLLGIIIPGAKVSKLANNRILFRDGKPIAVYEAKKVRFIEDIETEHHWEMQQMLLNVKKGPH